MQWRLFLEEYSPELVYIQGSKNVAANALSRLDLDTDTVPVKATEHSMAELFALKEEDILHQDDSQIKIAKERNDYSIKHFHGADKKYSLICRKLNN